MFEIPFYAFDNLHKPNLLSCGFEIPHTNLFNIISRKIQGIIETAI